MVAPITKLTSGYLMKQRDRIQRTVRLLRGRDQAIAAGRVIPSEGVLANGRGRHLTASVMFLDLCGFSARAAESQAEQHDILTAFALFFPEMIAVIEDYQGFVEKNTGDGLMAYFDQQGQSNDATKAVACAMTIMDAADRFIRPELLRLGVLPFDFRICIDRGAITVARVGRKTGFGGYVAIGTTANLVSKMLAHAPRNSILIGDNMLSQLPVDWLQGLSLAADNWGWNNRVTGAPYRAWELTKRWPEPRSPEDIFYGGY